MDAGASRRARANARLALMLGALAAGFFVASLLWLR
jgi:hypothetical protein